LKAEQRTISVLLLSQPASDYTIEERSVIQKTRQLFGMLVIVSVLSGCGINNIPTFDEAVNGRWSEVQNQFKRRADLVPNLISTVKGFAAQEKDVLTEVTEARTRVSQMNITPEMLTDPAAFELFQQNQGALTASLQKLRRDYISAVQRYNTELRTIPGRWWARFMYPDMEKKENFSVSAEDAVNPTVNFN